jgi:hypothetical protein
MKKILACFAIFIMLLIMPLKNFANTTKAINISMIYGGIHNDKMVVFLKLNTSKDTKIYWKYSGFGGIAPIFSFTKNLNIKNINILYNAPQIKSQSEIINYTLNQEDYIAVTFEPDNPSLPIKISGNVTYGYCDTLCKSDTYHFDKTFSASQKENKKLLKEFFKNQPQSLTEDAKITIDELQAKLIGDKNLLVSFQIFGIKEIDINQFIYYFDTELEIKRPIIRKIQPDVYNISLDFYNVYEKPKKIFLLFPNNDKKIMSYQANLP